MPWASNGKISQNPIAGGIAITEEQYSDALAAAIDGKLVSIDGGFAIVDPDPDLPDEPHVPTMAEIRQMGKNDVDAAAEISRRKFITGGSGQAMTYMQKADEARRYLAAADPVEADYPLLAAEVGITAASMRDVADVVIAAYSQWQIIGAAIEQLRLGNKAAIDNASTVEQVVAIIDAIVWP